MVPPQLKEIARMVVRAFYDSLSVILVDLLVKADGSVAEETLQAYCRGDPVRAGRAWTLAA